MESLEIVVLMLMHNRVRILLASAGVAVAFFLVLAQFGLLVGWITTCTAIVRNAYVDLWVMAEQTPAFDYGTAIPEQCVTQARSVPGMKWAEGMFVGWNIWNRQDGRKVSAQLVGLDKHCIGGPWRMLEGEISCVLQPNTVIVDDLYRSALGFERVGQEFEMMGRHARISGISTGVRALSASPFVFTSLKQAIQYDQRYRDDEITYVMARCAADADPVAVKHEMQRRMPQMEVLTTAEFATRTALYWMLETGVGITVLVTACLGLAVSIGITSQTLYAITQEHLSNYATLLALGFRRGTLVRMVLAQSLLLGLTGVLGGSALFFPAAMLSARTPIPLETTPMVYAALVIVSLASSGVAALMSVRTIFHIDPVKVFHS